MEGLYNYTADYLPFDYFNKRWRGKKIVFFGDSRTWYDGQPYTASTKPEIVGQICKGYQQTIIKMLDITALNEGINGGDSTEISAAICSYDFSDVDAVFIEGGINDPRVGVQAGTVQPIGSTFDTTTSCGAWQTAIEYILNNYPNVKIYMDVTFPAWDHGTYIDYSMLSMKKTIAELYNIPCLDLFHECGINELDRAAYYADNVASTGWYLHANDKGNERIGYIMAGFIDTH